MQGPLFDGSDDEDELIIGTGTDDHDADGPADDDDVDQAAEAPVTAPAGQNPAPGNRKQRQADRKNGFVEQIKAANDRAAALERQMAAMAQQVGESATASRQVADAVRAAGQPAPEDPIARAKKKIREAAAAMRDDDPASAQRFLDAQTEINAELYAAQAAAAAGATEARIRQSIPQPDPPHLAALYQKADWLRNEAHAGAVAAVARRVATSAGHDLQNVPPGPLRDQFINQAIVQYGTLTGLPFNVPQGRPANPGAVAGAGSRAFSGAAGAAPPMQLSEFHRSLADQDPNFKDLPRPKRYQAYAKMLSAEVKQARRG